VINDLKKIYQAANAIEAEQELENSSRPWDAKYPTISKQWRLKCEHIISMFEFPPAIRKAIYTTNTIESINSVIRKFTRNRKQYPNRDSALKLIYLAIHEASKKMDDADPPLEIRPQSLRHPVRKSNAARLTKIP
jgi:putative transposase